MLKVIIANRLFETLTQNQQIISSVVLVAFVHFDIQVIIRYRSHSYVIFSPAFSNYRERKRRSGLHAFKKFFMKIIKVEKVYSFSF